jgi:hypothetical protein
MLGGVVSPIQNRNENEPRGARRVESKTAL